MHDPKFSKLLLAGIFVLCIATTFSIASTHEGEKVIAALPEDPKPAEAIPTNFPDVRPKGTYQIPGTSSTLEIQDEAGASVRANQDGSVEVNGVNYQGDKIVYRANSQGVDIQGAGRIDNVAVRDVERTQVIPMEGGTRISGTVGSSGGMIASAELPMSGTSFDYSVNNKELSIAASRRSVEATGQVTSRTDVQAHLMPEFKAESTLVTQGEITVQELINSELGYEPFRLDGKIECASGACFISDPTTVWNRIHVGIDQTQVKVQVTAEGMISPSGEIIGEMTGNVLLGTTTTSGDKQIFGHAQDNLKLVLGEGNQAIPLAENDKVEISLSGFSFSISERTSQDLVPFIGIAKTDPNAQAEIINGKVLSTYIGHSDRIWSRTVLDQPTDSSARLAVGLAGKDYKVVYSGENWFAAIPSDKFEGISTTSKENPRAPYPVSERLTANYDTSVDELRQLFPGKSFVVDPGVPNRQEELRMMKAEFQRLQQMPTSYKSVNGVRVVGPSFFQALANTGHSHENENIAISHADGTVFSDRILYLRPGAGNSRLISHEAVHAWQYVLQRPALEDLRKQLNSPDSRFLGLISEPVSHEMKEFMSISGSEAYNPGNIVELKQKAIITRSGVVNTAAYEYVSDEHIWANQPQKGFMTAQGASSPFEDVPTFADNWWINRKVYVDLMANGHAHAKQKIVWTWQQGLLPTDAVPGIVDELVQDGRLTRSCGNSIIQNGFRATCIQ